MKHLAAAGMWIGADVTAVLIGVASSFVWLCMLFSIKPSLRLTWEEGHPGGRWLKRTSAGTWQRCSPRGTWPEHPVAITRSCKVCETTDVHYRVEIENLGLAKVVDIEVRLWRVTRRGLANRTRIAMPVDQLLELNGKWQERRHKPDSAGNRFFHFLLPCEVSGIGLGAENHFLFQVQSKHGLTNFSRVQKLRIVPDLLGVANVPFGHFSAQDPDAMTWRRRSYARVATLISFLAISKHVHAYNPSGWYHARDSATPVTVVQRRCACGLADIVTLSGHFDLRPRVPCLDPATPDGG